MNLFCDDFKIIRLSDGYLLIDGNEVCRQMYRELFNNSPNLFGEIINRIDFGSKIILHEYIHGKNGGEEKRTIDHF